jgi:hypothetical protein
MKYLKVLLIAIVAVFTFGSAKAQVVVRARIGAPAHRHYYHRRPVYHHYHHRYYRRHHRSYRHY